MLDLRWHGPTLGTCIKSRADALANLPNPGKVVSRKGDAANSATKRVARMSALLGKPKEGFLCRNESPVPQRQLQVR